MVTINVGLDHQRQPRHTLLAVRRNRHQVAALDLSASLHSSPFPSTIPARVLPWDLGQPAATGAALLSRSSCAAYLAPRSGWGATLLCAAQHDACSPFRRWSSVASSVRLPMG